MAISTKQSCIPSDDQFFYNWQSPQLQSEAMGFWVRVRLEKRDALFRFLSKSIYWLVNHETKVRHLQAFLVFTQHSKWFYYAGKPTENYSKSKVS